MHFRKQCVPRSNFNFKIGPNSLQYVSQYKYLGIIFNDKMDFSIATETLGKAGGRALGGMISKIHNFKDVAFKTFETLFESCVVPVIDYCAGVWGYKTYHSIESVQNRAIRYF